MSKKTPQQNLPHYGIKNGLTRKGKTVGDKTFESLSKAKRYMRTGSATR
jgi:hypothetical protein